MANKVALVTGASSGIGEAIVRRLLDSGHVVYAAARRTEPMAALADLGAHLLSLDVTSEADLTAAVSQIESQHGGVDVLINNAGFGLYGPVQQITLEQARYQFEVNVFGAARLTQLVLPHMRARQSGTIVNITSMGGRIYTPLGAWYHATKHALEGWSDCLRLELEPEGIHVVVVQPGIIRTAFGEVMNQQLAPFADGPYARLVRMTIGASSNAYSDSSASSPQVVADVVGRALGSARPRTRYKVGARARSTMYARKWLSDRMFDRIIMRAYSKYDRP